MLFYKSLSAIRYFHELYPSRRFNLCETNFSSMDPVPYHGNFVFIATTVATFGFIYSSVVQAQATPKKHLPLLVGVVLVSWMALVAWLAHTRFFLHFDSTPPRLLLAIGVPALCIAILLSYTKTRQFLLNMPISTLTYIHIVRVPVEIILWWLYLAGNVPQLMTFEGINYDILSGVTAPFIAIFAIGFKNKRRILAIVWNLLALALLVNIVGHAILSAPGPFQQLAFNQPNIGVFYFPYIWLPAFIVPAVLFAHLVSLIKLCTGRIELK